MKLLLFCPHFEPDLHAATGEVMTRLVHGLVDLDYEVSVVTSLPWYRSHSVEPTWRGRPWRRERTEWGQIIRAWPFPTDKSSISARAAGFVGQTTLAAGLGLTLGKHDVVMGMSPPIFFGDAAWLAAKRSGAPLVFNTQDIFPDVAVQLGALNNPRVISLARRHERSIYQRADAVTVLSRDQAANVESKLNGGRAQSSDTDVVIIKNFVDLERISPRERINSYREQHGLGERTVIQYSGNVGLSQPFELIRAAATKWQEHENIVFVINGEGAARPTVDEWAKDLPNVEVVDFGPREQVPDILAAADIHLVILKRGLAASSTPSKLYSVLAAGRPVLASVDEGSEVANIVNEAEAGRAVGPEDESAFLLALEEMLSSKERLRAMGASARNFAETMLTPQKQAQAYDQLFRKLVSHRDSKPDGRSAGGP